MSFEFHRGRFESSEKIWCLSFEASLWFPVKSAGSLPFTIKQRRIGFSFSLPRAKK
jgi:hypothetical protein